MSRLELPTRAAVETAQAHGVEPDRADVLQDGSTLVLRLTDTLVARVVTDVDGPRQGDGWFSREVAVARHLAEGGAPVIPVHPALPPGPYEHLGYTLNFWQFVHQVPVEPEPEAVGRTLLECHRVLRSFPEPLPALAIVHESRGLLPGLAERGDLPGPTLALLEHHLASSLDVLGKAPAQPLHGDAHAGNLLNTTGGLLWTDWEDTFAGPPEWDLASIVWNPLLLEDDRATTARIISSYLEAGGQADAGVFQQCLIARAAVITAWYPILYPRPDEARREKLERRIQWLEACRQSAPPVQALFP